MRNWRNLIILAVGMPFFTMDSYSGDPCASSKAASKIPGLCAITNPNCV